MLVSVLIRYALTEDITMTTFMIEMLIVKTPMELVTTNLKRMLVRVLIRYALTEDKTMTTLNDRIVDTQNTDGIGHN